jgi:two-component system NarL family sensor kinase
MSSPNRPSKLRLSFANLRVDWVEIGGLGRLAVAGVVLALSVTLFLGASITRSARGHLLDARSAMVSANIDALPPFPAAANPSVAEYAVFDVAVRVNVLGGETVRVKVWDQTGTIVYSDAEELQGRTFDLPSYAAKAFAEGSETHISDLSEPAHSFDRGHGELIEFYVALPDPSGTPSYVVEVEQDARGFNNALSLITPNIWASIGIGLAAIGLVMAVGVAARTREVNSRRRQAEGLLDSSFRAQEEERRRVVSALHDDIGQPMYRLLYGLEGSQARLKPSDPVSVELGKLAGIVRDMDATLRNELRLLHFELAADTGLSTALEELADLTRAESALDVELTVDDDEAAPAVARTEMYRAAREALTNVRKHSSADKVSMHLFRKGGWLVLEVWDNGTRQDSRTRPGLGLSTTRRRFKALDGDVTLEFNTSGATFSAWLPTDESSR